MQLARTSSSKYIPLCFNRAICSSKLFCSFGYAILFISIQKKDSPWARCSKGKRGWVCCYKGTNVIRNNKTFSEKVSKIVWSNYRELSYWWKQRFHSPVFWGMFPHTFLIFHTIYFWRTKHKHLTINTYHFHSSFWHADCDYDYRVRQWIQKESK